MAEYYFMLSIYDSVVFSLHPRSVVTRQLCYYETNEISHVEVFT